MEHTTLVRPPHPAPIIKGGGEDLPKIESLGGGGGRKGITLKRGVDVEIGGEGCHFYYLTVQLHLLCVGEKVKFY